MQFKKIFLKSRKNKQQNCSHNHDPFQFESFQNLFGFSYFRDTKYFPRVNFHQYLSVTLSLSPTFTLVSSSNIIQFIPTKINFIQTSTFRIENIRILVGLKKASACWNFSLFTWMLTVMQTAVLQRYDNILILNILFIWPILQLLRDPFLSTFVPSLAKLKNVVFPLNQSRF